MSTTLSLVGLFAGEVAAEHLATLPLSVREFLPGPMELAHPLGHQFGGGEVLLNPLQDKLLDHGEGDASPVFTRPAVPMARASNIIPALIPACN